MTTGDSLDDQSSYSNDRPIDSKISDRFGRSRFAERIGDTLAKRNDPSTIVVGLYGPWGDGKTSTLHLIEEHLRLYTDVVIIRFNPWHFGSQETLIKGFFNTLATGLGVSLKGQGEKLKSILDDYGSLLSNVPLKGVDLGKLAKLIGKAIKTPDLDGLKERVNEQLRTAQRRIVVMIDDVDRLDRAEIHEMLKLVKLSGDFSYVSYVLAFDDEMVAQSIGDKYGAGDTEAGHRFLEKIVQVPLQLPPAAQLSLRQFAVDGINEALRVSDISLGEEDAQAFLRHFVDGIEPQISTPRHAARYGNALIFALPLLKDEVNATDQMLLEGIRVFYLPLYKVIRDNPDYFLKEAGESGRRDAYRQRVKDVIGTALVDSKARDPEGVRIGLLEILFPRLKGVFGNWSFSQDSDDLWCRQKRIASTDYFPRYFAYGLAAADISDASIARFLSGLKDMAEKEGSEQFRELAEDRDMARVIAKLRRHEETLAPETAIRLASAIASNSALIPKERAMMFSNFTRMQASGLLRSLLLRVPEPARESVTESVVRKASLPFAFELFQAIRAYDGQGGGEKREGILARADEALVVRVLVDRIRAEDERTPLYRAWGDDAPALYWIWQTYGDAAAASAALRAQLNQSKDEVTAFLDIFVGWSHEIESGIARRSDLMRDTYNSVARIVEPDLVVTKLRDLYGSSLDSTSMHAPRDMPTSQRIAMQFVFIHRQVNASHGSAETESRKEEDPLAG